MSLRNHMISSTMGVYEDLDVNGTLNVDGEIILQGQVLNPSGGSSTNITNTDGSITVTKTGGNIVLSNAGSSAVGNVNMNNNIINNVNAVTFNQGISIIQNDPNCLTLGKYNINGNLQSSGNIYDSNYNKPSLGAILGFSNNALGNSITNLNKVQVVNTQISGGSAGTLTVSDGTTTGIVYDSHFNIPPSSGGGSSTLSTIAFKSNSPIAVSGGQGNGTAVPWQSVDQANNLGSSPISLGSTGGNQQLNISAFQNNATSSVVVRASGFICWDTYSSPTSSRVVYIVKNAQNSDRYGYSNVAVSQDVPVSTFSVDLVLAPNDTFQVFVWHNDGSTTNIFTQYGARIIVTTLAVS